MKNVILIISAIMLVACTSQKETTTHTTKAKKEGRKIYGTVTQKHLFESANRKEYETAEKPRLSFKVDNEYYYIRLQDATISEQEMERMVGEKIEVRGQLYGKGYGGELPTNTSLMRKPIATEKRDNAIGHIVIYEILHEE